MFDKPDAALCFQQEAFNLCAQRQGVLAANIADTSTPGYQIRDIDLTSELKKVMQHGQGAISVVALTMTLTQYIPAQALMPPTAELQYRIPDQPPLDGNTVDVDRECAQFAGSSLQYQMSLNALNGQIKGMINVLQSGNQRMALLNIFDIVGSALTAQSRRLNVAADNLANADSVTDPDGQPYRAKQVVFQVNAVLGAATGGVKVTGAIEGQAPDKLVYEPGNPLANTKGYMKILSVDVVEKMVNTISASRSYQANIRILNTVKSTMLRTLILGQ